MKLSRIEPFEPEYGDDLPVKSMRLEDMPEGFHFEDIVCGRDCPLTLKIWADLTAFAERWYSEYEVVAPTAQRFKKRLQNSYDINADTLEKMLQVYNDDIAKPLQSRTIKRTYDLTDTDKGSVTDTPGTMTKSKSKRFDHPIGDSISTSPTEGDEVESETSGIDKRATEGSATKKGTETEEWSDVGVAPNYVLLNGFIDNNRTAREVFVNFFKENFTLMEGITW